MASPSNVPPSPRKLILRTGNIMSNGLGPVTFPPTPFNSTTELLSSLRSTLARASKSSPSSWLHIEPSGTVHVPSASSVPNPPLSEDRPSYDITAKLFYLPRVPPSARASHAEEALGLVCEALGGIENVDLVIVSFPGIGFDADDEVGAVMDENSTLSSELSAEKAEREEAGKVETETVLATYNTLADLVRAGKISKLGVSEFGSVRLRRLLRALDAQEAERERKEGKGKVSVRPRVDQINVRDCCVVPRELVAFAKREGVELLTHNDGGGEVLAREGAAEVVREAGIWGLWTESGDKAMDGDRKEYQVFPQWVVKYTAVVRDRGVVENKGYIAVAEVR
ncbi:hypothetical protein BDZ91DRAFT_136258 [Kalaharituber pfeilii]|nr:hypothetical protein BDZ91DRAFT_136258 [Kalaharituber pfeilii]